MIIGNQQAQGVLDQYIAKIQEKGSVAFPFLLLDGPEHIGKTTLIETAMQELLGSFYATDYLPIYDLSGPLEKKQHALKVSVADKDQRITIDEQTYVDMWARELVSWLSLAPMWTYKVLFLENIERMTIGAANAFLKPWEEPLPGRIIIATTSNKDRLLDTIVSRAYTISFHLPTQADVATFIAKRYADTDPVLQQFVSSFSLGRIGLARSMFEQWDALHEQAEAFARLCACYIWGTWSTVEKYHLLKQFSQRWYTQTLIDAVIMKLVEEDHIAQTAPWLQARNTLNSNVWVDNILFGLAL